MRTRLCGFLCTLRTRLRGFLCTLGRLVWCARCCGNCRHFHAKQGGEQGHCGLVHHGYTIVFTLHRRDYCLQWESYTERRFDRLETAGERNAMTDHANPAVSSTVKNVVVTECHFSEDISETISCCRDGKFDDYGFPVNICKRFPCAKYKELVNQLSHNAGTQVSARSGDNVE